MKSVYVRGMLGGYTARYRCEEVIFNGNAMTMTQAQQSDNANYIPHSGGGLVPFLVIILPIGAQVEIR